MDAELRVAGRLIEPARARRPRHAVGRGPAVAGRSRPSPRSSASLACAAAIFGPFVGAGGRYLDDWWLGVNIEFPRALGFGSALDYLSFYSGARPGAVAYWLATYELFGFHDGWHRALSVALAGGLAAACYLLLRELRLGRADAAAIALLTLALPVADAIHFWITPAVAQLCLTSCLLGLLVGGARAARAADDGRSRCTPLAGAPGRVAAHGRDDAARDRAVAARLPHAGRLAARGRALVGRPRARRHRDDPLRGELAGAADGRRPIGRRAGPRARDRRRTADAVHVDARPLRAGARVGARRAARRRRARRRPARAPAARAAATPTAIRRWLVAGAIAALAAAASYAIYVPADSSYLPLAAGVGNRVNIGALVPLAVLAFAVVRLLGGLVAHAAGAAGRDGRAARGGPRPRARAAARRPHAVDRRGGRAGHGARGGPGRAAVTPPRGASLLVLNAPGVVTRFGRLGHASINQPVPVFSTWWELDAAVKLRLRTAGRRRLSDLGRPAAADPVRGAPRLPARPRRRAPCARLRARVRRRRARAGGDPRSTTSTTARGSPGAGRPSAMTCPSDLRSRSARGAPGLARRCARRRAARSPWPAAATRRRSASARARRPLR